eukprot:1140184-Pelagomonas_calceolata.AAC.1
MFCVPSISGCREIKSNLCTELVQQRLHLEGTQKRRKGKGYVAVPAYEGSSAEAKNVPVAIPILERSSNMLGATKRTSFLRSNSLIEKLAYGWQRPAG